MLSLRKGSLNFGIEGDRSHLSVRNVAEAGIFDTEGMVERQDGIGPRFRPLQIRVRRQGFHVDGADNCHRVAALIAAGGPSTACREDRECHAGRDNRDDCEPFQVAAASAVAQLVGCALRLRGERAQKREPDRETLAGTTVRRRCRVLFARLEQCAFGLVANEASGFITECSIPRWWPSRHGTAVTFPRSHSLLKE